jgi:Concanavalin A-like lectin/glucanases superfamily/FecR protein
MKSDTEHQLLELLEQVRENENPTARAELNDILRAEPGTRRIIARLLVDEQAIIGRMRDDGITAMLEPASPKSKILSRRASKSHQWTLAQTALAAAAVAMFAGFLAWLALHPHKSPPELLEPIAILKEEANAVWLDSTHAAGGSLVPGKLKLSSGMAAIEFTSGARVLIEGPAVLDLVSNMEAKLQSGSLLADVPPPAQGFTIATPEATIIDRGTSFGVSVRESTGTLVKVLSGKVDLVHGKETTTLPEDQAASVGLDGIFTQTTIPDETFPSAAGFTNHVAERERHNSNRWRSTLDSLSTAPSTVLHYHFEETSNASRAARNHATHAPSGSDASIVGTRWTDGRWTGKRAIEFTGPMDRILFKLSGSYPAATYMAWVRVDSLPNSYHILLMPDSSKASALQWMIDAKGNLRMAITNRLRKPATPEGWEGPVKAPAISTIDFGRWIFLASTYDSRTGEMVHYRDGESIGSGFVPAGLPVNFSTFSCGNWASGSVVSSESSDRKGYRNIDGRMDELTILSRALTSDEIRRVFLSGKP